MENNLIHEKILSALSEYDKKIQKLIISGMELSHRTGTQGIAQRLYKELDQITKEES